VEGLDCLAPGYFSGCQVGQGLFPADGGSVGTHVKVVSRETEDQRSEILKVIDDRGRK